VQKNTPPLLREFHRNSLVCFHFFSNSFQLLGAETFTAISSKTTRRILTIFGMVVDFRLILEIGISVLPIFEAVLPILAF
jgi:hypothetical protein